MKPPKKKAEAASGPSGMVNWAEVNQVLEFMSQHGLEEFEYAQADVRIHLRKPGASGGAVIPFAPPPGPSVVPASTASTTGNAQGTAPVAALEEGLHTIKSPIVGTFYNAPKPDAPPFVKAGDQVRVGQVLCIVEAMKLMNEIESEVAGELVRALVENGEPVEYGQPLFAIRPVKSA